MGLIPQLDDGHADSFTVYLDLSHPYSMGWLTDDAVRAIFAKAVSIVRKTATAGRPLGQFRLTTKHPASPGRWETVHGLRPGEYLRVVSVPSLAPLGGSGTGYTTSGYEQILSLYQPFESYICVSSPVPSVLWDFYGVTVVHETLHAVLPWTGQYGDQHLHTVDPDNILHGPPWGAQLAADPTVSQVQRDALIWNFNRCRRDGMRTDPRGTTFPLVKVLDGGRPAWPPASAFGG